MKTPLKKLLIYGLASGVGLAIKQQEDRKKDPDLYATYRAKLLSDAGQAAVDVCRTTYNKSRQRQVKRKIDQICKDGEAYDIVEMLSFLILGIQELQHFCKDTSLIDVVEKRAVWFTKLYDPKLDNEEKHIIAYQRYEKWIKD